MRFESRPRYEKGSTHRIVPPEETVRRMLPYMRRIGVTRIADTTGLDTIGMPVFSAIRPTDADLDGISVYNGKGLTKADSRAGAMMEAVERYRGESWLGRTYRGTYREVCAEHPDKRVMDPASMRLQMRKAYDPTLSLDWVDAWDLLEDRPALVATNFVLCPFRGPARGVFHSSTNGLASGNCIEEAVVHALLELIERDAYTIAMVRSELVRRFEQLVERVVTAAEAPLHDNDAEMFPVVDLDTVPPNVRGLIRTAARGGAEVMVRSIASDIGIPTFLAFLRSREADGTEFPAGGFGCDTDCAVAMIRAITEAAQSRNVRIQGVREDAKAVKPLASDGDRALWRREGVKVVPFDALPDHQSHDILDDLKLILSRLKAVGVSEAYAVDLTDPEIPASVARVIVPEMESWFLTDFSPDTCRLGERATRFLGAAKGRL